MFVKKLQHLQKLNKLKIQKSKVYFQIYEELGFQSSFSYTIIVKEDKEYKKEKRTQRAKQKALERQADELLKRDEEFQKLKEQGHKIDVEKFKKLI